MLLALCGRFKEDFNMNNYAPEVINDDHLQLAEDTLNDDEAFAPRPYRDVNGIWTVGFGFNLESTPIPRAVANLWKTLIVEDIDKWLSSKYGYYRKLSRIRKSVLINMTYQLGKGGIQQFKKMHKALMGGDYVSAIDEMRDSKWYRNHKYRADRLIYMMRFEQHATREEAKSYYTNQ